MLENENLNKQQKQKLNISVETINGELSDNMKVYIEMLNWTKKVFDTYRIPLNLKENNGS